MTKISELQEIQQEVKKTCEAIFEKPLEKTWKGSDPEAGFDENSVFSTNNWNDARINLFRSFFAGLFHNGISNEVVYIDDLEIVHFWSEDQNYVSIRNEKTGYLVKNRILYRAVAPT